MGKKNKKQNVQNGKKAAETTQPKGGSAIIKDKQKPPAALQQKKNVKPNIPKQSPPKKVDKSTELPKKVDEAKLKEATVNIAGKKKKKRNKKGAAAAASGPTAKPAVPTPDSVKVDANGEPVTLTKRIENRLKSKLKKEIAMKGKSKLGLADPKLVARKLAKLKNKAEPRSKAAQRNILLLEKLLKKLLKMEKQNKSGAKDTSKNAQESDDDSDDGDSDIELEEDSDDEKEDAKPAKKAKKEEKKQNGKGVEAKKDDKFFLFVGNLPKDITDDKIREHFKSAGILQTVKLPVPRRKKCKRFAYIKLADEPSKQLALKLHGSTLEDKKITVLYADKSRGKSALASSNAKLNAIRKQSEPQEAKSPAKQKNKNKKKLKAK